MNTKDLWQNVLTEIELNVTPANFNTWFKSTNIQELNNNNAVIEVPSNFIKEWLNNKYRKLILKFLRNYNSSIKDVDFIIKKELNNKTQQNSDLNEKLNIGNLTIDQETGLNPKYTFESFVVGPFNELAYAAANAVVKDLGNSMYNPLFVYGGVGIGKTHLIQAIGNEAKKYNLGNIKYIQLEKFTSGFISALQNKTIDKFRAQFKNINLLIIDDIQFLAGKEQTQDHFFHIFNDLYNQNKQIIISSDRHPQVIPTLEERLRSRLVGGTLADINYPDLETRIVIIKKKLELKNANLPDDVINYLATAIQKNIRDLEGAVNRILMYKKLNTDVNLNFVKKVIEKNLAKHKKITTFSNILKIVSEFYDLNQDLLFAPSRKSEYVKVRQIVMYLLRNELKLSFPIIGEKLGGKDHTTVMYACEKIENKINNDEDFRQEFNNIIQKIYLLNN